MSILEDEMKQRKQGQAARAAILVAVAVLAAACGSSSPTAPPPVTTYNVALASAGGTAVTGTAVIEDNDGPTSTVRVELVGLDANSAHAGHVHKGSCVAQGAIFQGLQVVTAGADGRGTATTAQVPDSLLTGEYYIQYHVGANPPGAPIACGDLPE
jgi:hypothetical protein